MTRARLRALGLAVICLVAAALALAQLRRPAPAAQRPVLLLLTGLPLVFGEDFSINGAGSPALTALQSRYRVIPISVSSSVELAKGRLLLMAQPFAQPPEDLVALDQWVRGGGRVLLLADPLLEWPSARPLGDRLRPPVMFTDTGLLGHWGLRLDAPDHPGMKPSSLGNRPIVTVSPGSLHGGCRISVDGIVARCRIGRGRATVVADADLLDADNLGSAGRSNLEAISQELDALK
jgi:hypothetical protein